MESCISVRRKEEVMQNYMEMIMNEENDWDHNVERYVVEGPVDCISGDDVALALNENWRNPMYHFI